MNKRIPKIDITVYGKRNNKYKIVTIMIDGTFCSGIKNSPIGNFREGTVLTEQSMKKLHSVKTHDVNFIEVDKSVDIADIGYAWGNHGCDSFDEYVERCNFPEDYE